MTKKEVAEKFAEKLHISKRSAEESVDTFIDILTDAFVAGEDVSFVGFGKFSSKKRAEKKGRNPKTGEEIIIPACIMPSFTPGKALKEKVNG